MEQSLKEKQVNFEELLNGAISQMQASGFLN
jgi:hypothetical protein